MTTSEVIEAAIILGIEVEDESIEYLRRISPERLEHALKLREKGANGGAIDPSVLAGLAQATGLQAK